MGVDTIERLQAIHSRVSQHHTIVAAEMIGALIADVENEARLQRIVSTPTRRRTNGTACPYGYKPTKSGMVRNRKHTCGPECSWSSEEALEWLRETPYKIAPGLEIMSRLVPVPPCAKCDRPRSNHWEAVAGNNGRFQGFRRIPECDYTPARPGS
ncbi:MAG: hypothetical protein IIC91_01650 [Chloroflexi bacterium]|nr:hypothetical protein [Chloroflexota bacterium]